MNQAESRHKMHQERKEIQRISAFERRTRYRTVPSYTRHFRNSLHAHYTLRDMNMTFKEFQETDKNIVNYKIDRHLQQRRQKPAESVAPLPMPSFCTVADIERIFSELTKKFIVLD
jgi:hypothetical protein